MRVYELAIQPLLLIISYTTSASDAFYIIPQLSNDLILFSNESNAGMQLRHQQQIFEGIQVSWQTVTSLRLQVLTVQR